MRCSEQPLRSPSGIGLVSQFSPTMTSCWNFFSESRMPKYTFLLMHVRGRFEGEETFKQRLVLYSLVWMNTVRRAPLPPASRQEKHPLNTGSSLSHVYCTKRFFTFKLCHLFFNRYFCTCRLKGCNSCLCSNLTEVCRIQNIGAVMSLYQRLVLSVNVFYPLMYKEKAFVAETRNPLILQTVCRTSLNVQ